MELILGIPIGIFCSLIAWWILYHGMSPKIEFSAAIQEDKERLDGEKEAYEIRLDNKGYRGAIDLEIIIRFFHRIGPGRMRNHDLPYRQSRLISLNRNRFRYVKLELNGIVLDNPHFFGTELRDKAKHENVALQDLLNLEEAGLRVYVLATDSFSGARHLFRSPIYDKENIEPAPVS